MIRGSISLWYARDVHVLGDRDVYIGGPTRRWVQPITHRSPLAQPALPYAPEQQGAALRRWKRQLWQDMQRYGPMMQALVHIASEVVAGAHIRLVCQVFAHGRIVRDAVSYVIERCDHRPVPLPPARAASRPRRGPQSPDHFNGLDRNQIKAAYERQRINEALGHAGRYDRPRERFAHAALGGAWHLADAAQATNRLLAELEQELHTWEARKTGWTRAELAASYAAMGLDASTIRRELAKGGAYKTALAAWSIQHCYPALSDRWRPQAEPPRLVRERGGDYGSVPDAEAIDSAVDEAHLARDAAEVQVILGPWDGTTDDTDDGHLARELSAYHDEMEWVYAERAWRSR